MKNTHDCEYILVNKGMEKRMQTFWMLYELTLAQLMAKHIKRRRDALVQINNKTLFKSGQAKVRQRLLKERNSVQVPFFNADSPLVMHLCTHVTKAEALDDVYNAMGSFTWNEGQIILPEAGCPDFVSQFHFSTPNGQAVRNRYRIVKELFKEHGKGKTLSIACGSAQPLLHAMHELVSENRDLDRTILLTDASQDSLNLAKRRAEQAGVLNHVSFLQASFQTLPEKLNGETFQTVEACGIMDYLNDRIALKLIRDILNALEPGGRFLISNMIETWQAASFSTICNWELIYRTPKALAQLIKEAGGMNVKVYVEPWHTHAVAIAQKG